MKPDRKADPAFDAPWIEIPDPLRAQVGTTAAIPAVPRAPSPNRRQMRLRRFVALTASVVWPIAILAAWGLRRDAGDVFGFLAWQTTLWTALLIGCAVVAISRGRRGLGAPMLANEIAAVGVPIVFMLLALFWSPGDATGNFAGIGTLKQLRGCVGLGLFVLLPMLAVSAWALRRSFPAGASWRGAALGAACGVAAALVLTLHCGVTLGGHIALAHGGPIVLAALVGALVGSKLGKA